MYGIIDLVVNFRPERFFKKKFMNEFENFMT